MTAFNNEKYIQLQSEELRKRISIFPKLYLEIGGQLLSDSHASRVLPGFENDNKVKILKNLNTPFQILFCIDYEDILSNRQLSNTSLGYLERSIEMLDDIKSVFDCNCEIVVNKIKDQREIAYALEYIYSRGYKYYKRYHIDGYPDDINKILSNNGYQRDDYIKTTSSLIIVTGPASDSGKMSTCLGQIYLDKQNNIDSGYAKYETFPIWNLPLNHPINLAYEAATADIGDHNVIDTYHLESYGIESVNYNRDVNAFKILKMITNKFISDLNKIKEYKSPTDMGINMAGYAIINDKEVCFSSLEEIKRRKEIYKDKHIKKICEELETEANRYITTMKYS